MIAEILNSAIEAVVDRTVLITMSFRPCERYGIGCKARSFSLP